MKTRIKSFGLCMMTAISTLAHAGSSFNETWNVVTHLPVEIRTEMREDILAYGTPGNPKLPQHSGSIDALTSIVSGALKSAAQRTVQSQADFHPYFKKLVHANGICFAGSWEITEDSKYSGYFKKGQKALLIGRISAATPQTTNDGDRSFGLAGKLFPTLNPDEEVTTANFFTVHDLNGTSARTVTEVTYVNEPPVDLSSVPLKIVNAIFEMADQNPGIRPLYPIARAGLSAGESPITPRWMRLRVLPSVVSRTARDADFRDELSVRNYPEGLIFTIEVSDTSKDPQRKVGWQAIGQIRTSPLLTSFGCDRRLHFHHSKLKDPAAR